MKNLTLLFTFIVLSLIILGCSFQRFGSDGNTLSSSSSSSSSSIPGMVTTEGTQFMLNGESFYYNGTNQYYLFYSSTDMIDEVIEDSVALGLTVLRTWGFGDGIPEGFQPQRRKYDSDAWEKMDYILKKAEDEGIKLIIPLVNYWSDFGGMDQYVAWSLTGASTRDDFYTDVDCRGTFKLYIREFLNRENTLKNGLKYKDDPTIMMWEVANEPRIQSDPSGNILFDWIVEMSEFIKGEDANHLVSTGLDGFKIDVKRSQYLKYHNIPSIDACSIHLYPEEWEFTNEPQSLAWIAHHVFDAHEVLGKPIYLGEFGIRYERGNGNVSERNRIYTNWFNKCDEYDIDGVNFWLLSGHQDDGALYPDYDNFTVYYPEDYNTSLVISNYSQKANQKCGQQPQALPPTDPIDNFEGYEGSNEKLDLVYARNLSGNFVDVHLDTNNKNEGNYGMRYDYSIGTPSYTGIVSYPVRADWSRHAGIKFWLKPDGSNRAITLQYRETDSEYWEAHYTLSGTTAQLVELPFSSFAVTDWSEDDGTRNLTSISEFSIYLNRGSGTFGSGSIYFDSIELYEHTLHEISRPYDFETSQLWHWNTVGHGNQKGITSLTWDRTENEGNDHSNGRMKAHCYFAGPLATSNSAKGVVLHAPSVAEDLTDKTITVSLYVPDELINVQYPYGLQIFIKSENWTWDDGGWHNLIKSGWNEFRWDLKAFPPVNGNIKNIIEIGFQISQGEFSHDWEGDIYFDDIDWIVFAPATKPFDFETFQTWHWNPMTELDQKGIESVSWDTTENAGNNNSDGRMKLHFDFVGPQGSSDKAKGAIIYETPVAEDLTNKTIRVNVFVTEEITDVVSPYFLKIFIKSDNWIWDDGGAFALTSPGWNEFIWDLGQDPPTNGNISNVINIGFEISKGEFSPDWEGDIYFDDIYW